MQPIKPKGDVGLRSPRQSRVVDGRQGDGCDRAGDKMHALLIEVLCELWRLFPESFLDTSLDDSPATAQNTSTSDALVAEPRGSDASCRDLANLASVEVRR